MLDYKLLEALAAVVDEGGFDKGARALHVTQSAISQRIKLLEDRVGQLLVVRATPVRATSAGQAVLAHFKRVRALEHDLEADLTRQDDPEFTTLPIGVNADSLITWFMPAVQEYVHTHRILLDIHVDDQEQTHTLLRDGVVTGCVSTRSTPMQGCRCEDLGDMTYMLVGSHQFRDRWFPHGMTAEDFARAPAIIYNRKDELHQVFGRQVFGASYPTGYPKLYVPAPEAYIQTAAMGLGCGMVPEIQAEPYLRQNQLINLAPESLVKVRLYWHGWNLNTRQLDGFTHTVVRGASTYMK